MSIDMLTLRHLLKQSYEAAVEGEKRGYRVCTVFKLDDYGEVISIVGSNCPCKHGLFCTHIGAHLISLSQVPAKATVSLSLSLLRSRIVHAAMLPCLIYSGLSWPQATSTSRASYWKDKTPQVHSQLPEGQLLLRSLLCAGVGVYHEYAFGDPEANTSSGTSGNESDEPSPVETCAPSTRRPAFQCRVCQQQLASWKTERKHMQNAHPDAFAAQEAQRKRRSGRGDVNRQGTKRKTSSPRTPDTGLASVRKL